MTRIKICGLTRPEDIDFVNEAKPDYIGFVFAPSKRQVDEKQALALRKRLAPGIEAAGVFVDAPISQILELGERSIIDYVQLHGSEDPAYIKALRQHTHLPLIKAVSMSKPFDPRQLERLDVDYLLFDQGSGGSGKTFDWKRIPRTGKPFFLGRRPEPGQSESGHQSGKTLCSRPFQRCGNRRQKGQGKTITSS